METNFHTPDYNYEIEDVDVYTIFRHSPSQTCETLLDNQIGPMNGINFMTREFCQGVSTILVRWCVNHFHSAGLDNSTYVVVGKSNMLDLTQAFNLFSSPICT